MDICCEFFFITVGLSGYTTHISLQFVSLQASSGNCLPVSKPLTGSFLATTAGLWEGQEGFYSNEAILSVNFASLGVTSDGFTQLITSLEGLTNSYGTVVATQNLALNLVFLMTTSIPFTMQGYVQVIQFTAVPNYVFNRESIQSFVSNHAHGTCSANSFSTFDVSTATFRITFNYAAVVSDCKHFFSPTQFGYSKNPAATANTFTLNMDMRSFVTAFAVNAAYISAASLEVVPVSQVVTKSDLTFPYGGEMLVLRQLFNTRFPGMAPIVCVFKVANGNLVVCVVTVNHYFVLPVLNSHGAYSNQPGYCNW